MSDPIHNPALQRLVAHLYSLGPRPVTAAFLELARMHEAEGDLVSILEDFARASPEIMTAVGGDHFPPVFTYVFDDDGNPRPVRRMAVG
jgi:hypothetical protein